MGFIFKLTLLLVVLILTHRPSYLGSQANQISGSTPNKGVFSYKETNMADSSLNLTGVAGLTSPTGGSVFIAPAGTTPTNNAVATDTALVNQPTTVGSIGGYDVSGTGGTSASQVQALNDYYNTLINSYQGQLNTLPSQQNAAQLAAQQQYQSQVNPLQRDYALGQANLTQSQNSVNNQKAQSLQQIADQVRQQVGNYNNQLGAYGAGNSSAADLIKIALGQSASGNRQNVLQNASQQTNTLDQQNTALTNSYGDNLAKLDQWKNAQLSDISTKFAAQQAQLQQQMAGASAERLAQLASTGQVAAQQYLDQLNTLQNQVNSATQGLISSYQNAAAPQNFNIPSELQQYTVQPIAPGTLGQLAQPSQLTANQDSGTTTLLKRLQDQTGSLLSTG